jgi:Ca2+-binding EF-hand superfamily protein
MGSLQRDPAEVREFIENIDPNSNGTISFEEFINLMQSIENKIVQNGQTENNNFNSNE